MNSASRLHTDQFQPNINVKVPSRYARMIPGIPAVPLPRVAREATLATERSGPAKDNGIKPGATQSLTQLLFPHPIAEPVPLYRSVIADLLVIGIACAVQTRLLPAWSMPESHLPIFAVLITLFAFSEGVYRGTPDPLPAGIVPALVRSVAFATLLVFLGGAPSLMAMPATMTLTLASLLLFRQVSRFAWARHKKEDEIRRVLIVGAGPGGRAIARGLHADRLQRSVVRGFLDDNPKSHHGVLGCISDMDWVARAEFIDEIIVALPGKPAETRAVAETALRNHLDIRTVPDLPPGPWPDADVQYVGGVPLVTLHREPVPSTALFFKRLLDVTTAAAAFVLVGPLMAVLALLIRLDSPGPVFYAAERTGAKGRRFRCCKFRSMVTNADHLKADLLAQNQRDGPIFKIVGDPRITRVGRFIRRYSLDELPQLWNVLRGDMSLVGPRPHPVDDVKRYELHHYRRLDVKPGITGLWQITARNSPSFDLNMHLDLTYIENWSLRLDLRILLGTIRVLLAPEGV
jgi:exopolysaccharide biosynthesis polyprenyl glycosylphosphotransferase